MPNEEEEDDGTLKSSCCVQWEVTRGPHTGLVSSLCRHVAFPPDNPTKSYQWGRQKHCWMRLRQDLEISSVHAEVYWDTTQQLWMLRDLNSTNGTRVNGNVLSPSTAHALQHQDLIAMGKTSIRFQQLPPPCRYACKTEPTQRESKTREPSEASKSMKNKENQMEFPSNRIEAEESKAATAAKEPQNEDELFEDPTPRADDELVSNCMICGMSLNGKDVLAQHLHINACLDGRSMESTAIVAPSNGRKRKRLTAKEDDEQVALAMVLSKSLVDQEQEIDVDMALVNGEIASIEEQMLKLTRKKEALVKKLEKLEKAKRKVAKSKVLEPIALGQLMNTEKALRVLFPVHLEAMTMNKHSRKERMVVNRFAPQYAISMWQRAVQLYEDNALYRTSVLAAFDQVEETKSNTETNDKEDEEHIVPEAVRRVFPNWKENLEFLKQQSVEELEEAIQELQASKAAAMDPLAQEEQSNQQQDERQAFIYFEHVMRRLMETKKQELRENQDESVVAAASEQVSPFAEQAEENKTPVNDVSVISIADSSQDPEENISKPPLEPEMEKDDNDAQVDAQEDQVDEMFQEDHNVDVTDVSDQSHDQSPDDESLDVRLMRALKRHERLYEQVLLLQPIELDQVYQYLRTHESVCTKQYLYGFLDRHGITYKSHSNNTMRSSSKKHKRANGL